MASRSTWWIALGTFALETAYLSYQWGRGRIKGVEWRQRVVTSAASTVAGVVGGALGAGIGCVIGNLICPGVGGLIGMFIG